MAAALVLVLLCGAGAGAWGTVGHQVVAGIAESLLSNKAYTTVTAVLNGESLVDVAMWADNVRRQAAYAWSSPLHFVDIEDRSCVYNYNDDCYDVKTGEKGVCITAAILNFTRQAVVRKQSIMSQRIKAHLSSVPQDEAVKFLVHFLGDIHQPLHTGFRGDLGGNSIKVTLFADSTNLHSAWDSGLISHLLEQEYGDSQSAWQNDLLNRVKEGGEWYDFAQRWKQCDTGALSCTAIYAEESVKYACENAYRCVPADGELCPTQEVESGADLSTTYYDQAAPVLSLRVAAGGVRLAALLEYLYGA